MKTSIQRKAKRLIFSLIAFGSLAGCAVYEPGGYPYSYGGNPYGPNYYDPSYYGPQVGIGFGFYGEGRGHGWRGDGRHRDGRGHDGWRRGRDDDPGDRGRREH